MKLGGFHFTTRRITAPIWINLGFPFRGTVENFPKSGKPRVPMSRRNGNRNPSMGYLGVPCHSVTETATQVCATSSFHVTTRWKPLPKSVELWRSHFLWHNRYCPILENSGISTSRYDRNHGLGVGSSGFHVTARWRNAQVCEIFGLLFHGTRKIAYFYEPCSFHLPPRQKPCPQ